MAKYVKNNDSINRTWCGQEILVGNYYMLEENEYRKWANDSDVITSISDATLIVSTTNDSSGHITDVASAVDFLKDKYLDVDEQGRQINRVAYAKAGWTYFAHPIEFTTAKFNSIYNKDYNGNNRNDITVKFYDVNNNEVTNQQNEGNVTKTVVTFKANYDFEMIAGSIRQVAKPTSDLRVWVIGGILELGGAYVKEFAGGLNLKYNGADEELKTDGRASKYMRKTTPGVPYQTNQIQIIVRHDAGLQHDIELILEYYKE
jgi:hypothetical protein